MKRHSANSHPENAERPSSPRDKATSTGEPEGTNAGAVEKQFIVCTSIGFVTVDSDGRYGLTDFQSDATHMFYRDAMSVISSRKYRHFHAEVWPAVSDHLSEVDA